MPLFKKRGGLIPPPPPPHVIFRLGGGTRPALFCLCILAALLFAVCDSPANALSSDKDITAFSFASPQATGDISGTNITVTVPAGTVLTSLIPSITHTGVAEFNPGGADTGTRLTIMVPSSSAVDNYETVWGISRYMGPNVPYAPFGSSRKTITISDGSRG
ncbi:MAG: hypothetical protein LBP80_08640 [Treponema sp.]|nr:hypothetical protein [Treponema sp.]